MIDVLLKIFGQEGTAGLIGATIGAIGGGLITGLATYFTTAHQTKETAKYQFLQNCASSLSKILENKFIIEALDFNESELRKAISKNLAETTLEGKIKDYELTIKQLKEISAQFFKNIHLLSNKKLLKEQYKRSIIAVKTASLDDTQITSALLEMRVFHTCFFASILKELEDISNKLK